MINPVLGASIGPPKAFLTNLKKVHGQMIGDLKSRVPAQIRKAVKQRYRKQDAKDKALYPRWIECSSTERSSTDRKRTGGNVLSFMDLSLEGVKMEFSGRRQSVRLSGVPAPFGAHGPYGSRKRRRASPEAESPQYSRGWVNGRRPWKVQTPIGTVPFGNDKKELFAFPSSKERIPLLFRRGGGTTSAGKREIVGIKTLSVPQEVTATADVWRDMVSETLRKRMAHYFGRMNILPEEPKLPM